MPNWKEEISGRLGHLKLTPAREAEIIEACRQTLAGYQRLQRVEFVQQIPKTPTGKILKGELRKRLAGEIEPRSTANQDRP